MVSVAANIQLYATMRYFFQAMVSLKLLAAGDYDCAQDEQQFATITMTGTHGNEMLDLTPHTIPTIDHRVMRNIEGWLSDVVELGMHSVGETTVR
jgi:hypothetical protein